LIYFAFPRNFFESRTGRSDRIEALADAAVTEFQERSSLTAGGDPDGESGNVSSI
jgi:hypothetical protein